MKKILLIAILALVCALTCALGLSACDTIPTSTHTHDYKWVDNGDGTHKQHCEKDGCGKPDINVGEHTWGADDKCDKCNAEKPADGHTHDYKWVDNGDGTHKQHCANDGCNQPDINSGSHTWGADDKCDKCSAAKPAAHTHDYHWVNNFFEGTHQQTCRNEGCDAPVINVESHIYDGGVCTKCYDTEAPEGHVHDYQWQDDGNNAHSLHCQTEGCLRPNPKDSTESHVWGENGLCKKCTAVNEQLHTHNLTTEYYCKGSLHYQYCNSCNFAKSGEHNIVDDACTICGHKNKSGDFVFTLNEDGQSYSVKADNRWGGSTKTKIVIPCEYFGKPVTVISDEAFKDNKYVTSVEIAGCCTFYKEPVPIKIGVKAFAGCTKLKKVVIPQTVTDIGFAAFEGCMAMEEITVPFVGKKDAEFSHFDDANFAYIFGGASYRGCNEYIPQSLKNIVITGGTFIAPYSLWGCDGAANITLPQGLTTIGKYALASTFFTTITIPDTVTTIGERAFGGSKITSITLPDGLETIEAGLFLNCTELTEITLGKGIKSIAEGAFENCEKLKKINYAGELTDWCGIDGLKEVTETRPALYINQELLSGVVTISDSVTVINGFAFCCSNEITEIVISAGVNSIEANALNGCSELARITVAENNALYASQDGILYNKAKTECLLVPTSLSGAITIPQGITDISLAQTQITSVNLPDDMTTIPINAFYGCDLLETVKFPDGVTTIGDNAFALCTSLKTIVIPDGVTRIGTSAFAGCRLLKNITVPNSVTSIGRSAFFDTAWYNSRTQQVVYAGNVAYCYNGDAPGNITLTLRSGTTAIADGAFAEQSSMSRIIIPDSVTSIGYMAFAECRNLKSITFQGTKAQWESLVEGNNSWCLGTPSFDVICTDETITVSSSH